MISSLKIEVSDGSVHAMNTLTLSVFRNYFHGAGRDNNLEFLDGNRFLLYFVKQLRCSPLTTLKEVTDFYQCTAAL